MDMFVKSGALVLPVNMLKEKQFAKTNKYSHDKINK